VDDSERPSRSHSLQFFVTVLLCALIVAGYVAVMRTLLEVSVLSSETDLERRDEVYLVVHGGTVLVAAVVGFLVGKWLNGLGVAYSLLFVIVTFVAMMLVLLGSYELACEAGQNGLIRHWECGPG
jgi:hypothetical protein